MMNKHIGGLSTRFYWRLQVRLVYFILASCIALHTVDIVRAENMLLKYAYVAKGRICTL